MRHIQMKESFHHRADESHLDIGAGLSNFLKEVITMGGMKGLSFMLSGWKRVNPFAPGKNISPFLVLHPNPVKHICRWF